MLGQRAARTYDVCDVVHFAMHVLGVTTARCVRIVREFVVSCMLHGWCDLLLGRRLTAIWYYSRHCISLRWRRGRCCGSVTILKLAACRGLSSTIDLYRGPSCANAAWSCAQSYIIGATTLARDMQHAQLARVGCMSSERPSLMESRTPHVLVVHMVCGGVHALGVRFGVGATRRATFWGA